MVLFECSFEVATRADAINVLHEMISHINGDYYCGYFSCADGSWSSCGEDEDEDEE